jgi:hypothetical protein
MGFSQGQAEATRQCVHCGRPVRTHLTQCPFCREMIPEVPRPRRVGSDGRREVRRGLLYMLLAAVIYYFAGGYSKMNLPLAITPVVTSYLSPLLFFGGLALSLYGVALRFRS